MSRKVFIAIAAALVAILLYIGFESFESKITNHPSVNTGIVAFGDSLIEGQGSSGGGFVEILSEELDISITNLGMSGNTTEDALRRVKEVTHRKPALTIILLGGNDFLSRLPEEDTKRNLSLIIEKIHESGSAIILLGLEAALPGGNKGEIFEELSEKYGTAYIPNILGGIFGRQKLMSDGLHPNDEGYRLMAEKVKPVLRKLLDEV